MYQGLSRRVWTVPLLVLFCAPLFIGLGQTDLQNDEAIYSFAVDSILETGDWLNPRSSPNIEVIFLEKPPLKFWIVALPIRLGLLPHNEFGLRFWDALFGAIAFLYVFAIGRRMAGPMCGLIAVLVLFADPDLLFEHGLRNNNMEAPLVLSYCAAVYHFLAWGRAERISRRRWHAAAVGLYFFLGFMTKFVAALFLPAVLLLTAASSAELRARVREDLGTWVKIAVAFTVVAAPWFLYQLLKPDAFLWEVMFSAHVYARFTQGVDPSHVQPWDFYFRSIYRSLSYHGSAPLVIAGAIVVIADAIRTRRVEAIVTLLWFAIPIAVMSLSSSKLYHYAYPVLPPVALAAGYAPARLFRWITSRLGNTEFAGRFAPRLGSGARMALTVVSALALFTAFYTVVIGPVRLELGPVLFRNSSPMRPLLVGVLAAILASRGTVAVRAALIVIVLTLSPLEEYWRIITRLSAERHPWRTASQCLAGVTANLRQNGQRTHAVYAPIPESDFLHPYFYYMRRVGSWERVEEPPADTLLRARLHDASEQRPIVIGDEWYRAYRRRMSAEASPPMIGFGNVLLIMPGPYAVCSPERSAAVR